MSILPLRFKPAREISIISYNNIRWTLGQNVKQQASTAFFCSFSEIPYCWKNRINSENDESSLMKSLSLIWCWLRLSSSIRSLINVAAKKVGRNKLGNLVFKFLFIKYLYYNKTKGPQAAGMPRSNCHYQICCFFLRPSGPQCLTSL